ncbi:MAG: hypothetical protein KDK70_07775 [Myxococcales bacterium]|nr:hypothetical protein [Myxococcales bacterium]
MRRLLSIVVLGALVGLAPSCEEEEAMCPGDPELHAFDLSATMVAPGDTIQATFEVHNFTFTMEEGHEHFQGDPEPLEFRAADHADHADGCLVGHVHIYLDDLMTNPIAMQTFAEGDVVIPADTTPGEHQLIARLHNADHTIIEPQVTLEQTITVQ